ncbi:MAG: extracellular solute-binding protein [Candidatus Bipolaricaulis sp.]|nr:extracellular solute-binding protein [Candidatus Bipolaricaulis sp.]MDD5219349.1 extracellular solute-binding protein [Candidatus Bipolaricaulis sp.]MDD5645715.1 extracellular solute-binding protein [Candidatus Bipolaricaulis sp.]
MRRRWLAFIGVAVLVGAVVVPALGVELVFWTHEDPNRTAIENQYIEEFQKMYPEVTIRRVTYPSGDIAQIILTAFAAHQGPDIFNMETEDEYPYIINRRVAPMDPAAAGYANLQAVYDAYQAGTLDAVTYEGKLYGLPMELTNWCIFLNTKYFREVGLNPGTDYPRTWEEMMAVSELLVIREGDILQRRGFDFRYPYYLIFLLPMVEQLGGSFLSEDGKTAVINDAAWLQVLGFFQEWGPNGKNLGSPTYTNARKLFNKDNNSVAMCLTGLYQIDRIRADNLAFYESNEWMIVPFPVFENAVNNYGCNYYGHYYMVNAESASEKQQWAWKFIAFMLSHGEDYLLKCGLIQPTNALLSSEAYETFPYADVFAADMARSKMVMLHEYNPQFDDLLREAIESVMLAGVTPEQALATLRQKANELLQE